MIDISLIVNVIAAVAAVLAVIAALYIHWDSSSPDVQLFLESDTDHGCSLLVVMNYGKKPAYEVEITGFDFAFIQPELLEKVKASFIAKGIPMLAPGQQRKTIITENSYAANYFSDACIQGEVVFKKKSFFGKRKISSSYALDYYSFANSLYINSNMNEIRKMLKSISKSLDKISGKLCSVNSHLAVQSTATPHTVPNSLKGKE